MTEPTFEKWADDCWEIQLDGRAIVHISLNPDFVAVFPDGTNDSRVWFDLTIRKDGAS